MFLYARNIYILFNTHLRIHFVKISEIKIIASQYLFALCGLSYGAIAMNFITIVNEIIFLRFTSEIKA